MDRYFAILAKSIADLGRDDADARASVYARVRRALDRLIAGADPKMPTSEQIAHQSALEEAIARTEQAYAARDAGRQPAAQPAPPRRRPPPETAAPPKADSRAGKPKSGFGRSATTWLGRLSVIFRRRLAKVLGFALVLLLVLAAGGWILLASLNAASVPDLDAVADRLARTGSATLLLGAGTERFAGNGRNPIGSAGGLFGPGAVSIRSSTKDASADGSTNVARIVLTPKIRRLLSEKTLRVTVVARSAGRKPSPEMAIAITDAEDNTSGWQTFVLDDTFKPYEAEYTFPVLSGRKPVIGIWADVEGAGRGVEINEISLWIAPD